MSTSSRHAAAVLGVIALTSLPVFAADAPAIPGGPHPAVATASSPAAVPTPATMRNGQTLYATYCAACHQGDGEGMTGAFPPLKGSAVVNRADATKHIDIVLGGLQGARVSGVTYTSPMPAFAATLSDEDVAAIIDYERAAWGNHGNLVGPAQVASERARLK